MLLIKYIIIVFFFTNHIFAKDLHYSDEYEIKFSSENIKYKKDEIIDSIKYHSFKKLINQTLTDDEYKKFNRALTIELINNFLFSLDINEEKINNNNYSSKIKIAYDNSKIIKYYINNSINFIPYEPEIFLLIIFDQQLLSENILSKKNRFYKYLLSNQNKFQYLKIPNLDINDRYLIVKDDFLLKNIKKYEQLKIKYKNDNIIFVHATSNSNGTQIKSYIYTNNIFTIIDNSKFSEKNYQLFFENLQNKAIKKWKNNNLVISANFNTLKCKIKTLNLIELKKIKEIINNNYIIKSINPDTLSYNNSTYNLYFYGNLNILIKSFKKNKLKLIISDNNCTIKIL